VYQLQCANPDQDEVREWVNERCLDDAVDFTDYYECFVSGSWWPAPENVDPNNIQAVLNTPKGVSCACYSQLKGHINKGYKVAKWVSLTISAFFCCFFVACCYLCLYSKTSAGRQLNQQVVNASAYLMRQPAEDVNLKCAA
jgi:hypothetical protein